MCSCLANRLSTPLYQDTPVAQCAHARLIAFPLHAKVGPALAAQHFCLGFSILVATATRFPGEELFSTTPAIFCFDWQGHWKEEQGDQVLFENGMTNAYGFRQFALAALAALAPLSVQVEILFHSARVEGPPTWLKHGRQNRSCDVLVMAA